MLSIERYVPVLLLPGSNVFMTFAWYGHLKYKSMPLFAVILASWGIAFFRVPADGAGQSPEQRGLSSGMQDVITLLVFAGFSSCTSTAVEVEPLGRLYADRAGGVLIFLERCCRRSVPGRDAFDFPLDARKGIAQGALLLDQKRMRLARMSLNITPPT